MLTDLVNAEVEDEHGGTRRLSDDERWSEWQVDRESAKLLCTSTVRGPLELPIVTRAGGAG
jgi:hypothetical protein